MKRTLSILVSLGIITGLLTSCSSETASTTSTTATTTNGDTSVTAQSDSDGATTSADSSETTASGTTELKTLSVFINMSWYPVDSFTGKIPDAIKQATGVDLDVTIATDSSQLGVMIASGELPDLVFTDTNVNELSDASVCYSLDDLTKETGVDFSQSENYEERYKIASSLSEDGQSYTLLNNYNSQDDWSDLQIGAPGQACIYYRKDLTDAAGITMPTSLDDFFDTLEQTKAAYPEMTPLGLGGVWKLQTISNWIGVPQQQYDSSTGTYMYDTSTEAYKDFLEYGNQLYLAGDITAEDYANENEADGHQRAYNDGCVFYAWYLSGSNLTQLQSNAVSETAEWAVLSPLGAVPFGTSKGWAGAFVSKNCSDPAAAATLVAYLNTEEGARTAMWGVEGDDYTLDDNDVPQFSDEYLEARNDSDTWYSDYNTMFYFGSSAIEEIYMNYSGMDDTSLDQFSSYAEGYKNYPEIGIAQPSTTSDEGVIKTKLDDMKKNYEAKVIFTDSDDAFESAWNEYMSALEQTGVQTYNDYMTKRIAEVKQEYGLSD